MVILCVCVCVYIVCMCFCMYVYICVCVLSCRSHMFAIAVTRPVTNQAFLLE
jgi:hypothetical protein